VSKDLLQDIVRVDYQPISLTFDDGNLHTAAATLAAGTLANEYRGQGLGTTWSNPYKRSAFVASFQYRD